MPPTSAKALPEPCQWLMLNIESPIIDCYNDDVPIDPNGKHLPWLWILLLPFIDESRIVNAFESIKEKLNEKEQHRNNLGCSYLYLHQSHPLAVEASKILAGDSPEHAKFVFDGKIGKGIGGIVYKTLLEGHGESVLCWKYDAPTYSNHKSSLLPGVIMPAPTLDDNDRVSTRGPRLNRGFNILDFTQQNNSSNSNQHKRFYDGKTQSNFNNNNNYRNNNNYNSSSNYANNNNHHKQPRVDYQQHATSNYSVNYGGNQNRNRSYPPQGYDRGNFPVPNQKYAQHGPQQNSFPAYYQNYNGMGFVPNQFGMESSYMQNLSIGRGEMSLANNLAVQAPPPSFPHPNMKSMREQLMQTLNRRDSTKGPRNQ